MFKTSKCSVYSFHRKEAKKEEKICKDVIEENSPDLKDSLLPIKSLEYVNSTLLQ